MASTSAAHGVLQGHTLLIRADKGRGSIIQARTRCSTKQAFCFSLQHPGTTNLFSPSKIPRCHRSRPSTRTSPQVVCCAVKEQQDANPQLEDVPENAALGYLSDDEPKLWSNVNEATLKHEPGSVLGSVLLVAGTTVGAGVLAIPAVTQDAGFLASAVACGGCWLYMVITGLLVAEVNINTMCELGSGGVSIVSMAERTLGKTGVRLAVATYIFLHYALLVAYVARASDILTNASGLPVPASAGLFTLALGGLCYLTSQKTLGIVNGILVASILATFAALVGVAAQDVHPEELLRTDWSAVPKAIPTIALAFVYQNVVPVVSTNLEGNLPKIRTSIVLGTSIPLAIFLIWDAVILGSAGGVQGGADLSQVDPLLRLREASGLVSPLVESFSLLAIATSYLGFVLGLSDFLADLLKLPSSANSRAPLPYLLTLLPPFGLALLNPDIFYKALDIAGTYGVLVLFGVIPAAMAWAERYSGKCMPPATEPLVPGGKLSLALVLGGATGIVFAEFLEDVFHLW